MSNQQICSRCGCTSFHYNRHRIRMECDSCGAPLIDPQQQQEEMAFDRAYARAMEHLAVGNWDQAYELLKPLPDQHPTDRRLYLGILRCATKDFEDWDVKKERDRAAAEEAWDKLVRLRGETPAMRSYVEQKREEKRQELIQRRDRMLSLVVTAIALGLVGLVSMGVAVSRGGNEPCFAGVCFILMCALLYIASIDQPLELLSELREPEPEKLINPFRTGKRHAGDAKKAEEAAKTGTEAAHKASG